jgi:hypothetical protein
MSLINFLSVSSLNNTIMIGVAVVVFMVFLLTVNVIVNSFKDA